MKKLKFMILLFSLCVLCVGMSGCVKKDSTQGQTTESGNTVEDNEDVGDFEESEI